MPEEEEVVQLAKYWPVEQKDEKFDTPIERLKDQNSLVETLLHIYLPQDHTFSCQDHTHEW
jgi:hypothetical protein